MIDAAEILGLDDNDTATLAAFVEGWDQDGLLRDEGNDIAGAARMVMREDRSEEWMMDALNEHGGHMVEEALCACFHALVANRS
jgi:hypothetical protein